MNPSPVASEEPAGQTESYLSIEEFCERYSVARSHYFRMRDRGEGPTEVRVGRSVRISLTAINEWEKAHTRQRPTPETDVTPAARKKPAR